MTNGSMETYLILFWGGGTHYARSLKDLEFDGDINFELLSFVYRYSFLGLFLDGVFGTFGTFYCWMYGRGKK